ncbi:MAG: cold shock domain-containing protein [Chloroflexota bacterium]
MNFRDEWVEAEDGKRFIFTVEMQRRLSEAGLPVEPSSLNDLDMSAPSEPVDRGSDRRESPQQEIVGPETIQIDPQTGKYIGMLKWFNTKKGYGFVVRGAGEEIFFHGSNSAVDPGTLDEGQWILYDVEETNKGPEATDVEPYEGETP